MLILSYYLIHLSCIQCKWTSLIRENTQLNCQFTNQANPLHTKTVSDLGIQNGHKSFAIYGWYQFIVDNSDKRMIYSISSEKESTSINKQLLLLTLSNYKKFQLTILDSNTYDSVSLFINTQNVWYFLFLQVTKQINYNRNTNLVNFMILQQAKTFFKSIYSHFFIFFNLIDSPFKIASLTGIISFLKLTLSAYFLYNMYLLLFSKQKRYDNGNLNIILQGNTGIYIQTQIYLPSFSFSDKPNLALFLDSYPFDNNYSLPSSCSNVKNMFFYSSEYELQDIQFYMNQEPQIIAHYQLNSHLQQDTVMDSSFNENNAKIINFQQTQFNSDQSISTMDFSQDSHIIIPQSLDLFEKQEFILSFYARIKQNTLEWNNLSNGPILLSFSNLSGNLVFLSLIGDSTAATQSLSLNIQGIQFLTGISIDSKTWNRYTLSYFCSFQENKFKIIVKVQNVFHFETSWQSNCLGGDLYELSFLKRQSTIFEVIWNIRDIYIFEGSLMRFQDTQGSNCDQLIGTQLGEGKGYCMLCSMGYYFDGISSCIDYNVQPPLNNSLYNSQLRQVSQNLECISNSLNRQISLLDNTCSCSSYQLYLENSLSNEECQRCSSICEECGSSISSCKKYKIGYDQCNQFFKVLFSTMQKIKLIEGNCDNFDSGSGCIQLMKNNQFTTLTKVIPNTNICSQNDNLTTLDSSTINSSKALTLQFTFNIVSGSQVNTEFPLLQIQDTQNPIINLQLLIYYRTSSNLIEIKFSLFVANGYQLFYVTVDLEEQKIEVSILVNDRIRVVTQSSDIGTSKGQRFQEVQLKFGGTQTLGTYCGVFLSGYFVYVNFSTVNIENKLSLTNLYLDSYKVHFRADIYKFLSQTQYDNGSDKSINNIINNSAISYTSQIKTLGIYELSQGQQINFNQQSVNNEHLLIVKFNFLLNFQNLNTIIDNYGWTIYKARYNSNNLLTLQIHQSTVILNSEYYIRLCGQTSCNSLKSVRLVRDQWYHFVFSFQKSEQYNQQITIGIHICINYQCEYLLIQEPSSQFQLRQVSNHFFEGPNDVDSKFSLYDIEVYSNTYITIASEYGYYDDNCFVQISPQTSTKNCLICMPNYLQKNYKCIPYDEKDPCQNSQDSSTYYYLDSRFNKCILVDVKLPKFCSKLSVTNLNLCEECVSNTRNPNNQCRCYPKNYEAYETDCPPIKCDWYCNECQYSSNICTSCRDETRDLTKNCQCKDGFYEDSTTNSCLKCDSNCKTCKYSSTYCLECVTSELRVPPTCDCYVGFFTNESTSICEQCNSNCKSCIDTANNCLECGDYRENIPNCSCQIGYVESTQGVCIPNQVGCNDDCEICDTITPSECVKCKSQDQSGINCECKDATQYKSSAQCISCQLNQYFDVQASQCNQCHPSCGSCSGRLRNQCLTCNENYQLNSENQCICEDSQNYTLNDQGVCIEGMDIQKVELETNLVIKITFSENIYNKNYNSISKGIKLYLTQVEEIHVNQIVINVQNNELKMQLEALSSVTSDYLQVVVLDNTLIENSQKSKYLKPKYKSSIYSFKVGPLILVLNEKDKETIKKMNQITDFVSQNSNSILNFFLTFMKRFFIIFYILNTIQPVSLILLVNTQLPPNLYSFLRIFGSLIFRNVPEGQYEISNSENEDEYTFWYFLFKIDEKEVLQPNNNTMKKFGFIKNFLFMAQDVILQFALILILLSILFIVLHYVFRKRFGLLEKLKKSYTLIQFQELKYLETIISKLGKFKTIIIGQVFGLLDQSYLILVSGIYLQIYCNLEEYNYSFFNRAGIYLSIIFVILLAYYGIKLFIALKHRDFKKKIESKKDEVVRDIFIEYDFYSRSYHFIGYFKKSVICFVVLPLIQYPNAVVLAVPCIKFTFFIAQIVFKSFKNRYIKILKIIGDSLLIIVWCLVAVNHFNFRYFSTLNVIPQQLLDNYLDIGFVTCFLIFLYNLIYFLIFVIQNIPIEKYLFCCKNKELKLIIKRLRKQDSFSSQDTLKLKKNKETKKLDHFSIPFKMNKGNNINNVQNKIPNPKGQKSQIDLPAASGDLPMFASSQYGSIELIQQKNPNN